MEQLKPVQNRQRVRAKVMRLKRKAVSVAVAMCFASQYAHANPSGANVVRGSATITNSGSTMSIANTPGAIINWHDFSINAGETTVFNQVNAASAVLNRVTGGNISQILGTLRSNGQVYLINPSGIVFGANAVVDVAGLVASTLNMTDADFIAGKKLFNADTANPGSVINHGQITTPNGGFVYLLAPQVENNGIITTPSGEAILAAGNSVEIVDSVNPTQRVLVSAQSQDVNLSNLMTTTNGNIFSVLNRGTVSANTVQQDATGRIFFKSAGSIQTTASSVIEAKGNTLNDGGKFIGFADTAGFYAGRFDASGKNGGFIETSGHYLDVTGIDISARALAVGGKSGDWLLDPYNITIATGDNNISAGPNFTPTGTGSTINSATILAALNSGTNVTIDTANAGGNQTGDIFINADIQMTGSSDASLTFNADGLIVMGTNTSITDTGAGRLSVNMVSDRDLNGNGTLQLTTIDVHGDVDLRVNTNGNLSFTNSTTLEKIQGQNVTINTGTGVFVEGAGNRLIQATNNLLINSGTGQITVGNSSNSSAAGVLAGGTLTLTTGGGVSLSGGTGANSSALVSASGKVTINTAGDVSLAGGSGAISSATIESTADDINVNFTSSGHALTLNGSANSTAQGYAIIKANQDLVVKGDTSVNDPIIFIQGGGASGFNFAGVSGNSISNIHATSVSVNSGAVNSNIVGLSHLSGGTAYIVVDNPSNVFSPLNITSAGSVSFVGNGSSVEIGTSKGNVALNIQANLVSVDGAGAAAPLSRVVVGAIGAQHNASVVITSANGGVFVDGVNAYVGSELGNAQVELSGVGSDPDFPQGVSISGGAHVGSQNGVGGIILTGTGFDAPGGIGVMLDGVTLANTSGNVRLEGTAGVTTINSNGVWLNNGASIQTTNGNIGINGTSRGVGDGVLIGSGSAITSSGNGNVILQGQGISNTGRGVSNTSGIIQTNNGNINITGAGGGTGNADGVFTNGTASIASASGNINISGVGSASGTSAAGVSLADSSNISAGGNVVINGTGQSASGNSSGVIMFGSQNSPTISSSNGNVIVTGTSVVTNAVSLQAPSISAANGSVSVGAFNNDIALGDAQITAGTAVNLNALAGNITQTSAGSIVAPKLNARALNINLGSLLNNFNSALFATNNLFTLANSASGTIDYEFSQAATVYDLSQDNATTLNITALNGLTFDGSMNAFSGSGSPIDNFNITASDLKLTNAVDIGVGNNLRVVAQSLTIDSGSSVSVGNNANIAAESISMDNSSLSAGNDINVLTKNLRMTSSSMAAGNNVNINSIPLAFKLAADGSNVAQIQNIFNNLTQGVQIGLRGGSSIYAANNTNIAGADIKLVGSEIGSGNITSVFSRNNIELTGGTNEARIFAQNEVLLVAGKQVLLNDGASAAIVETDSPNTIYLSFPQLSSDGYVINGVANVITNGRSGFFTGGIQNRTPAVLDTNFFVFYNDTSGLIAALLNRNFNELDLLTSDTSDSDLEDDDTSANSARECS